MIKSTFLLFLGWYEINLDKRKLRTPHGNIFRVPSEPLALAVATEWNSQGDIVNRHAMHLVSRKILFCTNLVFHGNCQWLGSQEKEL